MVTSFAVPALKTKALDRAIKLVVFFFRTYGISTFWKPARKVFGVTTEETTSVR